MARERTTTIRLGQGQVVKKGIGRFDLSDPYHLAVALSWPQFLGALLALYLGVNLVFAMLYMLVSGAVANAAPGSFGAAFFFSFETLATVGYGEMYPANLYGHVVACTEIVCGLAFTAILTGLTFVRFSRPRAKFVFAANPVVSAHDGVPTLMIRVANGRAALLSNAQAKLDVLLFRTTKEGARYRYARELPLVRSHISIFPLTWTLMHTIDEHSPLHGLDRAALVAAQATVFVSLSAFDPTLSTAVQTLQIYAPADVLFGHRYGDATVTDAQGISITDLARISEVEPE